MQLFNVLMYWIVWALGKRFKDKMVYLVAITYLVLHVVILGTTSEVMKVHLDDTDEEVPVIGMLSKICSSFGIYVLLLAPSIWHVVLVYVPGFIIMIIHFIHRHSEFEDLFIIVAFYMIIVLVTFWYIFQRRELKRFYQQEEAIERAKKAQAKEVEVTNVLNKQDDAVIIYSKKTDVENFNLNASDESNLPENELEQLEI